MIYYENSLDFTDPLTTLWELLTPTLRGQYENGGIEGINKLLTVAKPGLDPRVRCRPQDRPRSREESSTWCSTEWLEAHWLPGSHSARPPSRYCDKIPSKSFKMCKAEVRGRGEEWWKGADDSYYSHEKSPLPFVFFPLISNYSLFPALHSRPTSIHVFLSSFYTLWFYILFIHSPNTIINLSVSYPIYDLIIHIYLF